MLCERSLEHGNDVHICLVDFEKAFDRVNWIKMMNTLKNLGIHWRDRRLIKDLYIRQEVVVRIADGDSEPGIIGRGVTRMSIISTTLLHLCRVNDEGSHGR